MGVKNMGFFFINLLQLGPGLILLYTQIMEFTMGGGELAFKFLSGRLNLRPYNNLDKELDN